MKLVLTKDKVTPGTIRYRETDNENHPVAIYLTKDRVKELGDPESISIDIQKES